MLTFTAASLHEQISQQGWEVKKLSYDKSLDKYVAVGRATHGEELQGKGPTERIALSNLLYHIMHRNHMRSSKLSMWTHTFTDQLAAIAQAYSKAPVYEPKAAASFMELATDSVRRANAMREHLEILVTNNPEPYASPEKMYDDVRKRRKLEVSRANLEHPIWSAEQALAYRICHDVLGYCAANAGWDWQGENQAFAAHAAVLPEEAQKALFAESIGQTAYATYYQAYGPSKVALFPEFMDEAQAKMNPAKGYRGQRPDESHIPTVRPSVKPFKAHVGVAGLDPMIELDSSQDGSQRVSAVSEDLRDPNENWQSGIQPLQPNAYLDYRDPETGEDPLQSQAVMDNAKLIDTEWAYLNQDDPTDLARMKQAVVNAFRVVLLSPRKDLRWNAIHYQDIANIPGDEADPTTYWHTLEQKRQGWNVARFGEDARYSHMPYFKELKKLENLMYQKNPGAGWETAKQEAEQWVYRMMTRLQNQVMAEDEDKPEEKQRNMYQIELEANRLLSTEIKRYVAEHQLGFDFEAATAPEQQMGFDMDVPVEQKPHVPRYGAWMGTHLKAIAQISEHVDEILKAALVDVHQRDGTGHHFRATVLQLGVSGVGPKVCSFAWLLLQPMTSQLATIDTHMMDVLGYNFEKDMNNRDYFKYERELQAGRDAAGYGHVPLGAFQWGMWDLKRTGAGSHQDHSAMKVLDPVPHDQIDWAKKEQPIGAQGAQDWKANWLTNAPEWWQATAPARQQVADDWDRNVAPTNPQTKIPYNLAPMEVLSKTADEAFTGALVPWFKHPETGAELVGAPGLSLMQYARSVLGGDPWDIWQKLPDGLAGKR